MQAANNATDSVIYTRSQEVRRIVSMAGENIGRFYPGSPGDYFSADSGLVYDSGILAKDLPDPPSALRRKVPFGPATIDGLLR